MYARPKIGETDDDILRLQQDFLKASNSNDFIPAAKVTHEKSDNEVQNTHPIVGEDVKTLISNTFESIPNNMSIGRVVEKKYTDQNIFLPKFLQKSGFPQAKRRNINASGSKGSIFSQQMKRLKKELPDSVSSTSLSSIKIVEKKVFNTNLNTPSESYIITGEEKEMIHKENLNVLQQMSEKEILEEREKLLSTMDPAIVAFLKSKRPVIDENSTRSIAEQNRAAENVNLDDIEAHKEVIMHPDAEKWLNFDTIETGKLAWMTSIQIPKFNKREAYEARFDFSGWLLPFTQPSINESNRSLYHHGDEPGRPGYTLQELFQLCRSDVIQQKIIALNTISNILALHQSGVYDDIIELPLEQIFFVLRFCIDDNTPAVLNSSIKAIRNLFYYPIDETCLDNLLGFGVGMVQPILAINNNENQDDPTINDQQLAETNLIRCLVRTDILKRIRYIINTVKPSTETVVHCIEILIRLSRDSDFIIKQICKSENLLESLLKFFIPVINAIDNLQLVYGCPLWQALKLIRILCTRNKNITINLLKKYNLMDAIASYLSNEGFSLNSNGLKLQIESLHLWCVFLNYGLTLDYFDNLGPILWKMLEFHVHNTNLVPTTSYVIQGHVAALLNLLSEVAKIEYSSITKYTPLLLDIAAEKWITQCCVLEEFSCGKLQIVTALLKCLIHVNFRSISIVENLIIKLLNSDGFDVITEKIRIGSNLLNNYEVHTVSSNIKTIEAASWKAPDHIVPLIHTRSCLPFLNILAEFILISCNNKVKFQFIEHKNIANYLLLINNGHPYSLITNWFTKIESKLLGHILRMAVRIQSQLDTTIFYEIAVKSLSVFNSEQKEDILFILKYIIFSPSFYPCERLINNLSISDNTLLETALSNLNNVFQVYSEVLNIKMNFPKLSVDSSAGNVMPIDWIYSPIILLYSNQQENKQSIKEEQQMFIVVNCLSWIYIYETYFSTLAELINPTDRFCRIACTFLGSDSLFLNSGIHDLLEGCFKHILTSNESNINFSKPIQGLNNFQDFYTQLLEQYQGVSYGDVLFGNFILLPLIQRHNVKYRKLVWSEYAGVIQICNVTVEQLMWPIDLFISPEETDISLLKCYRRALSTGFIQKHSVLYTIAKHHVECFLSKANLSEVFPKNYLIK